MIIDTLMMFSAKQKATASESASTPTSNVVDFGQEDPRTGAAPCDELSIVVLPGEDFSCATFGVTVQESADNSDFTDLVEWKTAAPFKGAAFPMPYVHKRYLRLKYAVPSGGTLDVNAFVTQDLQDFDQIKREIW